MFKGIQFVEGDELDPVVEAYQIVQRLYEAARPAKREDFNLTEDEWAKTIPPDWLVVPYIGFVDPTDVNPLDELELYIRRRVMERLEESPKR
jgi:hypothetical protein